MIKVGIVGGTGYTGVELLRLLAQHSQVALHCITSRGDAGKYVHELYPSLRGHVDLQFTEPDPVRLAECDVVFFATPHGVAQAMLPELLGTSLSGPKIIDISADFRLRDQTLWESWYGQSHASPELIKHAVYGLPEMNREAIRSAKLVACPGCYPTAVLLGLMPLIEAGLVDTQHLIASAASGTSGAGRAAKIDNLLSEAGDSYKSYGVAGHRHLPEIEQELAVMAGEGELAPKITFVPHLVPMIRGMQASLYATLKDTSVDLQALFEKRFEGEPFVDVLPAGDIPQTRSVKSSNMCRLSVNRPQQRDTVVVLSVIDNLTKGSSGQAVQCMNLMFGFKEQEGLNHIAIMP